MPERLSIGRAWDETAALARHDWARLFPAAFLLLSLPPAIVQALAPVTAPGDLPAAGFWLVSIPELVVASLAGALLIARLALTGDDGLDRAFGTALRRLPALLGAALLLCLGAGLLAAAALLAAPAFGLFLALGAMLLAWPRLLLLAPAAAAERLGPFGLIGRSWRLTRGHYWRLLGTLVLVLLVSLVVLIATGVLAGIVAIVALGRPDPGSAALLVTLAVAALVQAAVSGLFTSFVARIYAQLAD